MLKNFNMNGILTLLLLFGVPTWASATPLTWEQCVERLSKHNEELLAAEAVLQAARHNETQADANFLPQISGNLNYGLSGTEEPTKNESTSYSASLSLDQQIFAGFSNLATSRQARARTKAAEENLRALKARLSKDLKIAFENLLFAERSIELQKSITARRRDNVRLVELRFQGGRENRGSVLLSKANLENALLEELEAQFYLRSARADLAKLLAFEDPEELRITGSVPLKTPPSPTLALRPLAMNTPAVLEAQAAEEIAQADLTIGQSNFYPKASFRAEWNQRDDSFFPQDNKGWYFGVGISIPLFNGGRDYARVRAQSQNLLAAIHRRTQAQKNSYLNLEVALTNYLVAVERVKVNEAFLKAEEVRAEIGRMRYNNGLVSFEDWYGIENDLINRQKNFLQSQRYRVHTEAVWEESQGIGVLP